MDFAMFGKRNRFIGLVALGALATAANAAPRENVTLTHGWKAGMSKTYSVLILKDGEPKNLGSVAVKVLSVAPDGTAQIEMKNVGESGSFTFTYSATGKIDKDPGGEQGLASALSLLLVLPRGEMTLGKDVAVSGDDYGMAGDATTKIERTENGKGYSVTSRIATNDGKNKFVFLSTYDPKGGLPTVASLLASVNGEKPTFLSFVADDEAAESAPPTKPDAPASGSATLLHRWRAGASRTYTTRVLGSLDAKPEDGVDLGNVAVKVSEVNTDGSAQVAFTNGDDATSFLFTFGAHGKIDKDPGGKQGQSAGLSLLLVLPDGPQTLGTTTSVDPAIFGFSGKATTTVTRTAAGDLMVTSEIVPNSGSDRYTFVSVYDTPGGLPKMARLIVRNDKGTQIFHYQATDAK